MTLKDKICALLLFYVLIPKEAILAGEKHARTAEKAIKSALDDGFIKDNTIVSTRYVRNNERSNQGKQTKIIKYINGVKHNAKHNTIIHCFSRKVHYFSLTEKGISYVLSKYPELGPIYDVSRKNERKGRKTSKYIEKALNESMVSYFAYCAGLKVPFESLHSFNEEWNKDYNYATPSTIKAIAQTGGYSSANGIQSNDFDRGRYAGALYSEYSAFLVYSSLEPGMIWNKNFSEKEKNAFELFVNALPEYYVERRTNEAILLVKNVRQFELILKDEARMRNKKSFKVGLDYDVELKNNNKLGEPFNMHIVPIDKNGIEYIKSLLKYDRRITDIYMRHDGGFSKYGIDSVFPEKREQWDEETCTTTTTYMATNYMLTLREIYRMYSAMKAYDSKNTMFGINCLDWQAEYYHAIFGEDFITKPKNINDVLSLI